MGEVSFWGDLHTEPVNLIACPATEGRVQGPGDVVHCHCERSEAISC